MKMEKYDFVAANRYDGHLTQIGRVIRNACRKMGKDPTPLLGDDGPSIALGWVQDLPDNGAEQILLRDTRILRPKEIVTIPKRTEPIDLAEVFQTREGLYVDPSLHNLILPVYPRRIEDMPTVQYSVHDLKMDALDRDIRKDLPQNHLSHPADIWYCIRNQFGGKEGIAPAKQNLTFASCVLLFRHCESSKQSSI